MPAHPRRFEVRVSAILAVDGALLVNEQHDARLGVMHTLYGGRLEWGERAADCLARELREELGLAVAVERLVCVHEYRYDDAGATSDRAGAAVHEVGLYFLVTAPAGLRAEALRPAEAGLCPRLLPLDAIQQTLFPEFLRTQLAHDMRAGFPAGVQHFVSGGFAPPQTA